MQYDVGFTAILQQVIPSQVYKGQTISFIGDSRSAKSHYLRTEGQHEPVENLTIDGVELNHEGYFDVHS